MKIGSREYKFMLEPAALEPEALYRRITKGVGEVEAPRWVEAERRSRWVAFFDTDDFALRDRHRLILRLRRKSECAEKGEWTLKHRHGDRFLVASTKLALGKADGVKGKKDSFEEDIKRPFVSLYSHSLKATFTRKDGPLSLEEACGVYKSLAKLDLPADAVLSPVRGRQVHESVVALPKVTLMHKEARAIGVEMALIEWREQPDGAPVAAEFSFRYAFDPVRGPGRKTVEAALAFYDGAFKALEGLEDAPTKTAWMYGDPHGG